MTYHRPFPAVPLRYTAECDEAGTAFLSVRGTGRGGDAPLDHLQRGALSLAVIRSFRGRETERIWLGGVSRRLPRDIQGTARRKLRLLHVARTLDDLRVPPGNRLEALKGERRGRWSARIDDRWRICSSWEGGATLSPPGTPPRAA